MPLLVTSASGANGDGFGALLTFELDGALLGTFIDDDRILDPRGLAIDPKENLLFLNSGAISTDILHFPARVSVNQAARVCCRKQL